MTHCSLLRTGPQWKHRSTFGEMVAILLVSIVTSLPVCSQEQKTRPDESSGGYGALAMKAATVNGTRGIVLGGKGAWIINHTIGLGGAGYILVSNVNAGSTDSSGQRRMMLSYGGLLFEYAIFSDRFFYPTVEVLFGGGAISHEQDPYNNPRPRLDGFIILEPGVTLNLYVTSFLRIEAGASYRIVQGLSSALSSNSDLSGMTANLALKFGSF